MSCEWRDFVDPHMITHDGRPLFTNFSVLLGAQ